MAEDDELFERMGALLGGRPHWNYEPSPTPGGAPSWCLDPGGTVAVAASVLEGRVTLYFPEYDHENVVGDLDGLTAWLDEHEAQYLPG